MVSVGLARHLVLVAISEDKVDLVQQFVDVGQLQYVLVYHLFGVEEGEEERLRYIEIIILQSRHQCDRRRFSH